jgi:hypothetical protein
LIGASQVAIELWRVESCSPKCPMAPSLSLSISCYLCIYEGSVKILLIKWCRSVADALCALVPQFLMVAVRRQISTTDRFCKIATCKWLCPRHSVFGDIEFALLEMHSSIS